MASTGGADGDRPRRGRGGRIALWTGVAMMLVGVVLLGYVGWQFWGTNWQSHRQQAKVTQTLQTQWEAKGTRLARLEPKYVPKGEASALIRIPAFGKGYVVPVVEGISTDVLARGFGHFPDSADPGQVGNYALAAHRVTHGEPLRRMPELRPGDRVIVETAAATYTYRLDTDPNKLTVPFTAGWVLAPVPRNPDTGGVQPAQRRGQRLITLTTCSEIFHTDDRSIAFGHLVKTVRKDR
jgi:sortase A